MSTNANMQREMCLRRPGDWGLGEAEAVTESRDQRKPSSQRHKAESAKVMILMMMSQSGLFIEITTLRPTQF